MIVVNVPIAITEFNSATRGADSALLGEKIVE